jgi:hypothetical protein
MGPKKKKQQKNDFYFFMLEQKKQFQREGKEWADMAELARWCSPIWNTMQQKDKERYK